jgi:hypothetical protein
VSSNVGYQALLYNHVLGSPATSHLAGVAHATTFDGFFREIASSAPINNDAVLAWLLERYLVPGALLSDGRWLRDYLARRISAACDAGDSLNAFVPVADVDRLLDAWIVKAPNSSADKFVQPLDEAHADARAARQTLDEVLHSKSWRVTAPLRALAAVVRTGSDHVASALPGRNRHKPALGHRFRSAR